MDKARVQRYVEQAQEHSESPIRVARFDEGHAVFSRLMMRMPEAKLIILPGVIYIAPSTAAVEEILRRLERELWYYSEREKVKEKEREIRENMNGIREMLQTDTRKYTSRNAIICK